MKQKHIGIGLIIAGILLAGLVFTMKYQEDTYIGSIVDETGSCYLTDGTCLHEDRSIIPYILGWSLAAALALFGMYLAFIDRTEEALKQHQTDISHALAQAKRQERERDEFRAFLAGFDPEEQKVLSAIKEQDGITQSTLRYRADMSKTALSLLLQKLEEQGYVRRQKKGKTKEVFLVKKY